MLIAKMFAASKYQQRNPHRLLLMCESLPLLPVILQSTLRMNSKEENSVLGQKMVDDSYPDGRVYCFAEYPKFLSKSLKEIKIKVSKDQTKVWFLWPKKKMQLKTIFGTTPVEDANNIHLVQARKALEEAFDRDKLEMDNLANEVNIPLGYTGEPIFEFPYQINRHLVDADGNKTKKVYFSKTAFRFWVKKTNARTCGITAGTI